jgi:hypothetical protein
MMIIESKQKPKQKKKGEAALAWQATTTISNFVASQPALTGGLTADVM